ncbi:Ulp1 protease family, catalytic domain protein [Aphelenchoides fujianensis]|nr:Ulp1 protease family, catalytic domain protein [Aphelenchoides fujianensis]
MDIINSDQKTMTDLRHVLEAAANFHREYMKGRLKQPVTDSPDRYFTLISADYFKRILSTLHKELYVEDMNVKGERYACGRIVNTEPNTRCQVQSDGRIAPFTAADGQVPGRSRATLDRSRTYALNRLPLDGGTQAKLPRISRLPPPRLPLAGEVHTIEDDAAQEAPVTHKVVATYQPNGKVTCRIYDQDLVTLNATEMLNDTIIDFYMNYILNDLLDTTKRDQVHVFNTYFFSKLSKDVYSPRSPQLRMRKIRDNYATLKSWTKSVNIFEKNYLVVPINEDAHWYLAIVAYPNLGIVMDVEEQKRANNAPELPATVDSNPAIPIFIFDSLMDPTDARKHRMVADLLLDYLALEYADKKEEHKLPGIDFRRTPCRVIVPKSMPQQENYYDCGIFMLQFAESFLHRLPLLDEIVDPFAYDSFFGSVDLSGKREHIQNLIKGLNSPPLSN